MDRLEELRRRSADALRRDERPVATDPRLAALGKKDESLGDRMLRRVREKLAQPEARPPETK
jgi:hypothetical protein